MALLDLFQNDDLAGLEFELKTGAFFQCSFDTKLKIRSARVPEILTKCPPLISIAAFYGAVKCFRYLMINKANLDLKDDFGRCVSHFACAGGNFEIIYLLYTMDMTLFHFKDAGGNPCTNYALMFRHTHIVYWLWDVIGLSVSEINNSGISPLHIAVANDQIDILEFLCQHGCDINQRNDRGETPLHFAAKKSNSDLVFTLLKHGADLSVKNNYGCIPYQLATFQHIQLLLLDYTM